MMSLQRLKRWHAMLAILSAASKWTLDKKTKNAMTRSASRP